MPLHCGGKQGRSELQLEPWDGLSAYTYPPAVQLLKVLAKIKGNNVEIILVALLNWSRSWSSELAALSLVVPWKLPSMQTLLKKPQSGFPPTPGSSFMPGSCQEEAREAVAHITAAGRPSTLEVIKVLLSGRFLRAGERARD